MSGQLPVAEWMYEALGRLVGRDHRESWASWDGSHQQAYLRGYVDAMKPLPVIIDGDPMPSVVLTTAWAVVTGYLQEADTECSLVIPADLLGLMADERRAAYAPVHDWWRRHYGDSHDDSPWEETQVES